MEKKIIPEITPDGEIIVLRKWKRESDKSDSMTVKQDNINQIQFTEKSSPLSQH